MPLENPQTALIAEQLARFQDNMLARMQSQAESLTHHKQLEDERHSQMAATLADLRARSDDYETRIRALTDAVTQYKTLAALATGGGALSVIALIREILK